MTKSLTRMTVSWATPTSRWWGYEGLKWVDLTRSPAGIRTAGMGASRPLRQVAAMVRFLITERTVSRRSRNWSSCPEGVVSGRRQPMLGAPESGHSFWIFTAHGSTSSNAFASVRSAVSNPSVNQARATGEGPLDDEIRPARAEPLAVLALDESAAIEFRCRANNQGRKDRDQQLGIREMSDKLLYAPNRERNVQRWISGSG